MYSLRLLFSHPEIRLPFVARASPETSISSHPLSNPCVRLYRVNLTGWIRGRIDTPAFQV